MMIVVANLRLEGFFPWIAQWFVRRAHAPETLLAVVVASNAGSAATITGNPQNRMIGGFSGIPDGSIAAALAPAALFGVVVTYGVLRRVHREEFAPGGGVRRDRLAFARPVRRGVPTGPGEAAGAEFRLAAAVQPRSNVPAVLLCKPFIERLPEAREAHRITFGEYARVGVPVSLLTVAGGTVWLLWLRP
jgi:Na+/H+ antiporter NhaD/arsenite permease-like protein